MSSSAPESRGALAWVRSRIAAAVPWDVANEPAFDIFDRLRDIHRTPLRSLRLTLWWLRKTFFTKPRSDTPALLVDLEKPEVLALLGSHNFEPGWEFSYHYFGEVLNMRRVEYREQTEYDWWQVHVRGFVHEDGGIELSAHYETEPTEHPDAHTALEHLETTYGMAIIDQILDIEDVDHEYLEPDETAADLDTRLGDSPETDPVEPTPS